ncbi:MAG: hypothetical protein HY452_00640 [Parcubacteria group bacterium]|nr:hypothetical protein [Parcubacteria group bacterium]
MEDTTNSSAGNGNGENQNNHWAWVVTGVVVAAIAIAFYAWPRGNTEQAATEEIANNVAVEPTDEYTASLQNVGVSDEVADIETDLNSTNINDLDREVLDVESEINAE